MRRAFLLALVLVGSVGAPAQTRAVAPDGVHELLVASTPVAGPCIASSPATLSVVWQEATGSSPRPPSRRAEPSSRPSDHPGATDEQRVSRARVTLHADYATTLALDRAGRRSFSTATPPPFRSV